MVGAPALEAPREPPDHRIDLAENPNNYFNLDLVPISSASKADF